MIRGYLGNSIELRWLIEWVYANATKYVQSIYWTKLKGVSEYIEELPKGFGKYSDGYDLIEIVNDKIQSSKYKGIGIWRKSN